MSGAPRSGYDANASLTSVELNTYASMSYLGGVTSGVGISDVFHFPVDPGFEWNQTFLAANDSSWAALSADGFLGLAFSTIADAGVKTIVETMMQDGVLSAHKFGLYYGTTVGGNSDSSANGKLTLGGSHESTYVEGGMAAMTYVPLQKNSGEYQLWEANMHGVVGRHTSMNGSVASTITYPSSGSAWAVFDTGAASITVPSVDIDAIYNSIGMNYTAIENGEYIPLCTEFNSSWSVTFQFGDDLYPQEVTLTGDQLAQPGFAGGQQDKCWPPFDSSDSSGLYLFGARYLFQLYTVFDFGAFHVDKYTPRIGFGQLRAEWKPTVENSG